MKHILRDHTLEVAVHHGKYSLGDNRALMLGEAHAIIEEASGIISDYAELLGFGKEHAKCKAWMKRLEQYASDRREHLTKGVDFRGGM